MEKAKKLKIGIFCTNEFSTPPSLKMKDIHAPLWITHFITEELVKRGHDVTLFASSDSKTRAKLVSESLISLPKNKKLSKIYKQVTEIKKEEFVEKMMGRKEIIYLYEFLLASRLTKMVLKKNFDIVYIEGKDFLPFATIYPTPTVIIINGPVDKNKFIFNEYKKRYPQIHFVAISESQRRPAPNLFTDVIHHGIKIESFSFNLKPKNFLLSAGRIMHRKGVHLAIQAAKRAKEKLIIVGRYTEDPYWKEKIKPNLGKKIEYKGLLPYPKMPSVYKDAKALLLPVLWEEPFGLVMIEAMACGTPVIAFNRGSVPEVVKNGKTGFIVEPFDKKGKPPVEMR